MTRSFRQFARTLLLAALLFGAQSGSLLHAYEHDPGAPQGKVCTTCATASQLSSACVDTRPEDEVATATFRFGITAAAGNITVHSTPVHQRGPPGLL